ncbi:MAG: dihydroneopterin aldolase, partial [Selenomonadaceae bacterium]|nr:dihydroneopterin aldolase [Selenomonadaceae bacterium]
MAKIRIHNMMFYGFHGIYEYEREQGQKFYIDVEVEMDD